MSTLFLYLLFLSKTILTKEPRLILYLLYLLYFLSKNKRTKQIYFNNFVFYSQKNVIKI